MAPSNGPRQWRKGQLDVEGLALGGCPGSSDVAERACWRSGEVLLESGATAAAFDSQGHLRIAGVKPEGFAPMPGFQRTSEGWIRLHADYPTTQSGWHRPSP
ncbi:hypothetical protein AHiyo4_22830 [Arthrobacter sp. Hiyo4]|nr:hypothetical protein AHiyo4_22830 [Arthrobacter sp. Hiyo4]